MTHWRSWAAVLLLAGTASASAAQRTSESHAGFTGALGVNKGNVQTNCDVCVESQSDSDFGFMFRAGWTLRPNYYVGVELTLWEKQQELSGIQADVNFNVVTAVLLWYPQTYHQYFLKGGLGIAQVKTVHDTPGQSGGFVASELEATGPLVQVGLGYDLRLGRAWSVTPYIDFLFGFSGKSDVGSSSATTTLKSAMLVFGAAVTIH